MIGHHDYIHNKKGGLALVMVGRFFFRLFCVLVKQEIILNN